MGQYSASPSCTVEEGTKHVIYVYTKNPEEKTTTNTPVKTSTSKVNAEKVTVNKATVLPQTGDKKENNSSVMGLVSLGLAGLLGLGIKRKEEKR